VNHLTQLIVMPFGLGASDSLALNSLLTVRGMVDRTVPGESNRAARLADSAAS